MEDLEKMIEQINLILDIKLKKLDALEREKKEILSRYIKANSSEKSLIEHEMKESEKKFKKLNEDVLKLSQKVKKLKKNYT